MKGCSTQSPVAGCAVLHPLHEVAVVSHTSQLSGCSCCSLATALRTIGTRRLHSQQDVDHELWKGQKKSANQTCWGDLQRQPLLNLLNAIATLEQRRSRKRRRRRSTGRRGGRRRSRNRRRRMTSNSSQHVAASMWQPRLDMTAWEQPDVA